MDNKNTIMFSNQVPSEQKTPKEILTLVYEALEERGYNPVDQIVGFILSGDPSYITSHNKARSLIRQIDRDDLVEELVRSYLSK
ncbi:IreB family regulatory phosphoprotein [Gallibacter intestinalis]|uniref:IreB family regulatory phosphoprotein n=1 Tax=Gallibacter intestinalis TaxID=2779356 RepID=A0ABR9QVS1_9FIRM|nr:IreB family regulatory phosphoprotein [Gallibacter intestinalis]MBE5034983.1 IreB family regulatory phosphoprotein [Gallibacter intestinalis]